MSLQALFFALVLSTLVAGTVRAGNPSAFQPKHIEHTGEFRLEIPPDRALGLFTAPGERLWVPDWDPTILSGDGTEAGTVFVTQHGHHPTIWVVVDYDREALRARYARTTPGVKAGTVEVVLRSDGQGSVVRVTYELTALSEAGNEDLAHFDDSQYSEMMKEWEQLIRHAEPEIAKHLGS